MIWFFSDPKHSYFYSILYSLSSLLLRPSDTMNLNTSGKLSLQTLDAALERWINAQPKIEFIHRRLLFKAAPAELAKIEQVLNKDIVLYLVVRMLVWLFDDQQQSKQLQLNKAIKQFYRGLLMEQYFRSANMFQLFALVHVKLTVYFIQEHFQSILIDSAFQGQLCVIFYHAILGVEVNEKTYQVLIGRYVLRQLKVGKTISSHTSLEKQAPAKRSIVSIHQKSKKVLESKRTIEHQSLHKSYKQMRISRMSMFGRPPSKQKEQSHSQNIEALLKENLYVPPLPKLKKKRMKINEFRRMITEPAEEQPSVQFDHEPYKPRSKYLFSNQLSTSIKTQYPEHLLFELNSKRIKLNQTFQNFWRENMMIEKNKGKNKENKSFYTMASEVDAPPRGKMQAEEWKDLVQDLKRKVYNLRWKDNNRVENERVKKRQESGSSWDFQVPRRQKPKLSIYVAPKEKGGMSFL